MYVQYIGFEVGSNSRTYTFHVVRPLQKPAEFTVRVNSEVFLSSALKFQDGPGICFERLKQELQEATEGARVDSHLRIETKDVHHYLERHYPKRRFGKLL
ncbi:MAG: hypothetical protein AB1898_04665 [Acidobacteriota bacterium]